MGDNFLVSVIVATYLREFELKRALESLIAQTHQKIQVIVVDDNANEEWNAKVATIIKTLKEKANFPIVHIINSTNLGSARARNVGIYSATGKYVCFLDDDDVYLPKRLENQVRVMENLSADYSITDLALYTESDKLIEIRRRNYIKNVKSENLIKYHLMHHMTGTDTLMFNREYLNYIGGFDPIDMGDEFYLMVKAIEKKGKFVYVPVCDIKAYVHTGEVGISSGQKKILGENELYKYKQKYFTTLDRKVIRYIKMRHYAVLAFAFMKMKNFVKVVLNISLSFLSSPIDFIFLGIGFIKK